MDDDNGTGRYYVDCEFDGHDGPLLSMALVRQDGRSIHVQTTEMANDPWVQANVMPLMFEHHADASAVVEPNEVGSAVRAFLGDDDSPTFVADSPVDIGRLCRALSTGSDGGWSSCGFPRIAFEVRNVDCYPTTLAGAVQHNAWWDAMALRAALCQP